MLRINELPAQLADKIAAGEVVERPASVLKELLENSIDAGARVLTAEIQKGGLSLIRVSDDGQGIHPEDLPIAFLRHATSKISSEADLQAIGTLGFRGEALAAIAAVSKVELITRTAEADEGLSIELEGGQVSGLSAAGSPKGTTVIVRDLFFNTPARLKFMKRDSAEASNCAALVRTLALSHPEISFRFIKDGAEQFHTPGDNKLMSAVYSLFGREYALGLVEVYGKWSEITVSGYVTKPLSSRGNRAYQHFFVNGRYIKSRLLQAALEAAYRSRIMTGRYPGCVLHLSLPADSVDVNVHPAKTEVKFVNEREIFDALYHCVKEYLEKDGSIPAAAFKDEPAARPAPKQDFFKQMPSEAYRKGSDSGSAPPRRSSSLASTPSAPPPASGLKLERDLPLPVREGAVIGYESSASGANSLSSPLREEKPPLEAEALQPEGKAEQLKLDAQARDWRLIGEAFKTYVIVESGDSLVLIDKHAAQESVLFEELKSRRHEIMSQNLLVPLVTTPNPNEAELILEQAELLAGLGFSISDFGGSSLIIRSVPEIIAAEDAEALLSELAAKIKSGARPGQEHLIDELLHSIACKAAVKAGQRHSGAELLELARFVMDREDIRYCPHGRPVAISLTKKDLEKQFMRIL